MLIIGQRIDGGNFAVVRKILHIALRESPDDGAVDHPSENARGVLDRFTASELHIVAIEKKRVTAQFANANLKGNACARGRFVENQRPSLTGQRTPRDR